MTWPSSQAGAVWQSVFVLSSSVPNTVQGHLGYSVHSFHWIGNVRSIVLFKSIAILYWWASDQKFDVY